MERVTRRGKVWFINFSKTDNGYFSLVIFERHFPHFTYKDEDLIGKEILAYGYLRKNDFKEGQQSSEMIIKSNKYIEFL